jgi:5-enolpyruvylshikimate-3-phosphate synthase
MGLAVCLPSATYNFEMASTYLENLCTPVLTKAQVRSMDSSWHLHRTVTEQRMTDLNVYVERNWKQQIIIQKGNTIKRNGYKM